MHVVVEQMTSSTAPVEEKRTSDGVTPRTRDSATPTAAGTSSCEEASEEGRTQCQGWMASFTSHFSDVTWK
jgi:hypothetical protein